MRKKLLGLSAMALTMTTPFVAIACSFKSDRVLFSLAQGSGWPLARSLKPLVEYYNNTFKNDKDFVPVKFSFADNKNKDPDVETHSIYTEFNLIKKVKEDMETGNIKALPNIILGAQSGAYIINQDQRLLDVSDQGINKDLFSSKIADLHSVLAGQTDTNKLYNIPFDNADTDSVHYNLKLMKKMFDLIEEGGGKVDHNTEIYKKIEESERSNKGNKIPEKSIWSALIVKEKKNGTSNSNGNGGSLKEINVTEETFKSIKSLRELASKFVEGIKIDSSKISENTLSGEVFSIDYQEEQFYKELHSRVDKDKSIFELENKTKNAIPKVKYNLIKDDVIKNEFKTLWGEWTNSIKRIENSNGNTLNKKVFQSMKFMANADKEWGSWNIFRFQSAFSLAASVGAHQNKITKLTRNHPYFKDDILKDPNFNTNNAKEADVFMDSQITPLITKGNSNGNLNNITSTHSNTNQGIFHEGGSSIIPINVGNEKINLGTKKFLKWIYKEKNKIQGIEEENWLTLAKTSGYIMPLKKVVNENTVKELEKIIKELEAKLNLKNDFSNELEYFTLNMLRSSLLSLKSLVKLEDGKVISKAIAADDRTSEITSNISKALIQQTNIDGKTETNADTLINQFEQIIKK
ncbi:glycerol ABC transporter substrate-binding protein [Mycoplasma capricolum subsp. capripneumoniae]|uniref:P68 family surface lipoprotein n=1 Tax=Mycoplasma capricolum TaxID=2095 RepID=UPI0004E7EC1C|nr:glycerol ABC transporter glycerol-binding protein [Mycoplasma capricolum]QIN46522.1 glycerol ABC transporter substrate-binding protein [Mycoplasma capricolum subsp. capripneumoniae]QIN48586.1 glycerol ABC transporter substrate-binding protein [Mycoplasma capricolum subsp. capripneumoniae]QIN49274.1 glycerol ABC transporter substrate-binding protein [Mycoplasma capricolum subsp. capripneumoniae]QIN50285.1 glycerol ABC transporter substrate-binding protein [Mycoplasma capricolum subsp. capripn